MDVVGATWKNGQIVLDSPVDWPEGLRLSVEPASAQAEPTSERDDRDTLSPEEIAHILAVMDEFEPVEMMPEELKAWQAERAARKAWEKAHFFEHSEELRRMWE